MKFFNKLICVSILLVIIFTFISPIIVHAEEYDYDDTLDFVKETMVNPENEELANLGSKIKENYSSRNMASQINRADYESDDEYAENLIKWMAINNMSKKDLNNYQDLTNKDLWDIDISEIPEEALESVYEEIGEIKKNYDNVIENGGSSDEALESTGNKLNDNTESKVNQDVGDIKDALNSNLSSGGGQSTTSKGSSSNGFPSNLRDFKPEVVSNEKADGIIGSILGILQIVGGILIVLAIAYIGFLTILGSAEEKASNKGKAIGIVIAAIMIFLGSTIAQFVMSAV